MDEAAPSQHAPPRPPYAAAAGAVLVAILIVVIGVAVPLQSNLKKEKAEATVVPPYVRVHRPPQFGVASWYGDHEAGQLTASGEIFDPEALTAAHRWLPLGTKVRVTRLGTNRSAVVRINDRGPFVGGRIIDLSRGAARRLVMVQKGLAEVRVDVISEPSPATQMVKRALRKRHEPRLEEMAEQPPRHKPAKATARRQGQKPKREPPHEPDAETAQAAPVAAQPVEDKTVAAVPAGTGP